MKKVAFLLPGMSGGGAERVAALLANEFIQNHIDVQYLLTHAGREEVVRCDLSQDVPLILFQEQMASPTLSQRLCSGLLQILSSLLCKPFEIIKKPVPAGFAKLSVISQYNREIKYLRVLMKAQPELTVIAFLQPAIPIALLAAEGLSNRIIISERGDPRRLMEKRYGRRFIEKYYTRADKVVFQTEDAQNVYPRCISEKGTVIPNPIKEDLPEPYHGDRNKNITTFCRIAKQKNLPLLIDAFHLLHSEYPEYRLRIIGDALNAEGLQVLSVIKAKIEEYHIEDAVRLEPFSANVHELILQDAMYVNSSDYEGISNAMLEAMAIGMPVVCTDCPIGGAKATICDGENGLLVPIRDADALYRAMKRLINDPAMAALLSYNAAAIKETLTLEMVAERWMELIP